MNARASSNHDDQTADSCLSDIRGKVANSETSFCFDDGVFLDEKADLFTSANWPTSVRERKNGNFAYYNVNTHLNPTNVCVYRCTFCAFRADLKSPKGYVMTDDQILERAAEAIAAARPNCTSSAGCTISCRTTGT